MVLGDAGWDKKEFPKSNLHMCGKDDTKIVVYNMGRCTKKEDQKKSSNFEKKIANSCIILLFNKIISYKHLELPQWQIFSSYLCLTVLNYQI